MFILNSKKEDQSEIIDVILNSEHEIAHVVIDQCNIEIKGAGVDDLDCHLSDLEFEGYSIKKIENN